MKIFHDERYFEAAGLLALYNCDIHEPVVENKTPLLSFMYIWVPKAIWRKLLMSFAPFARSEILTKAGYVNDIMIPMTPKTTIISIRVKARSAGRGELLAMDVGGLPAHHIAHRGQAKAKKNR